jgi:hypothetical protein
MEPTPNNAPDSGLVSDWTPEELHLWRRVESTWASLVQPGVELQRKQDEGEDWEYGPEATAFLDALDYYFNQTEERRIAHEIDWSKPVLTECLATLRETTDFDTAEFWTLLTFLRASTRMSRFPDNNDSGWFEGHFSSGRVGMAMRRLGQLTAPSKADLDRILALKPTFDSLSINDFRAWQGGEKVKLEDGSEVLHVPWPEYHPVVQEWTKAVWDSPFYIDPYHGAGPSNPNPHARFLDINRPSDFFRNATLYDVRQYMAVCIRGEKWSDGHIAGEFERGVIRSALARLETLAMPLT